jgi:acyl-CoA thioester hydrolase
MNQEENILTSKMLVRFSDCDPFNHLNNSKHIDYFLNAREDQLMQYYKFSLYEHSKITKCGWVVGQHEIAYLKPAFTMETVLIESMIIRWGDRDIIVEFKMWDETRSRLKSLMWTKFFYFDLTGQKSALHGAELNERFSQLTVEVQETTYFEKRLLSFKKAN